MSRIRFTNVILKKFTFTCVAFVLIRFNLLRALYACAQRAPSVSINRLRFYTMHSPVIQTILHLPCDLFLLFYFQSSTDFSCADTPRGPAHLHEEPVVRNGVHYERAESADRDPEEDESHDDEVGGLVNRGSTSQVTTRSQNLRGTLSCVIKRVLV